MLRLSVHTLCELTNSGDTNAGKALIELRRLSEHNSMVTQSLHMYHIQNSYRIPTPVPIKEGVFPIVWWTPDKYTTALIWNQETKKEIL